MKGIKLGSRSINLRSHPYIIAEIGVNHEGSFSQAKKLIDLAKEGGADAAKFQSYKADTLASKNSPAYWDLKKEFTQSQHELFKKYDGFNENQYVELSKYCQSVGIEFLSTPFDDDSIDFLQPLMPFYKIASADLTNLPFLRKIAKKQKPIVLSTGASTLAEIETAVNALREAGCCDVALLHCILNYPTQNEHAHLEMISSLKRTFPELIIGYSDHTLPDDAMMPLVTAYLLGAKIIEKHFTHDKSLPGNDHYHAMDVNDLKNFKCLINKIELLKGPELIKRPIETERISRLNARRSIVLDRNVRKGALIKETDLTYKRPGTGISPMHWDQIVGMEAVMDLKEDELIKWTDFYEK